MVTTHERSAVVRPSSGSSAKASYGRLAYFMLRWALFSKEISIAKMLGIPSTSSKNLKSSYAIAVYEYDGSL
jgi:hypothetical protein